MAFPIEPTAPDVPATYTPPEGTPVSNISEFLTAWGQSTQQTIILADGVYEHESSLSTIRGHQVYAENLGGATLRFGLTFGGNSGSGGLLRGLVFDIDDPTLCDQLGAGSQKQCVYGWGVGAASTQILDCEFHGNGVIGWGYNSIAPTGLVVRRCVFDGFREGGIRASSNSAGAMLATTPILEDLDIQNISRVTPGSSSGAAETGLFIGHNCIIRRVRVRDAAWAGITLANLATGVLLEDIDVDFVGPDAREEEYGDAFGVGIYCEFCRAVRIDRVLVGSHSKIAVNCEWNHGNTNPWLNTDPPRNSHIAIQNLHSSAYKLGIHVDLRAWYISARDCHFERSWRAAILDYNRFPTLSGTPAPPPDAPDIETPNTFLLHTCSFSLGETAQALLHEHHGGASAPPPEGWPGGPDSYDPEIVGAVDFTYATSNTSARVPTATLLTASRITRQSPIAVDVTADNDLSAILVTVGYPDGSAEVVYDGRSFTARYSALSSRIPIERGWRYSIQRSGGWPDKPQMRVRAVDVAGNVL